MVGDYAIGPEDGDVDANNKWLVDLEVRHVDTSQLFHKYINIIKLSASALGKGFILFAFRFAGLHLTRSGVSTDHTALSPLVLRFCTPS